MIPLLWLGLGAAALVLFGSKGAEAQSGATRPLSAGPPPEPPQPSPPAGYRRALATDTITGEMRTAARAALSSPIGTLIPADGWAVQVEWHFHEPGGPAKPWGWHKGATVYIRETA